MYSHNSYISYPPPSRKSPIRWTMRWLTCTYTHKHAYSLPYTYTTDVLIQPPSRILKIPIKCHPKKCGNNERSPSCWAPLSTSSMCVFFPSLLKILINITSIHFICTPINGHPSCVYIYIVCLPVSSTRNYGEPFFGVQSKKPPLWCWWAIGVCVRRKPFKLRSGLCCVAVSHKSSIPPSAATPKTWMVMRSIVSGTHLTEPHSVEIKTIYVCACKPLTGAEHYAERPLQIKHIYNQMSINCRH